ncbi:hypothetical protein NW762_006738 [Fusarium torreyae]|uniref:Uncharacterized protein n=1 Tax=Fusarium torreyae TaxID=1237075 RepID=A0A9W8S2Z8_9HYPO|nr:hypothetical protein NW762_006738 [Fusarium torreyae]
MASFNYITPPGFGEFLTKTNHYSQVVDLGNGIFKISGQGGWNEKGEIPSDPKLEVERAIQNVHEALQAAGLRGWEDVYYVRSYHTDIDTTLPLVVEGLKKSAPENPSGATAVGVARLALPDMKLEIEVDAKKHTS